MKKAFLFLGLVGMMLTGCEERNAVSLEKKAYTLTSENYLMFGHTSGFCMSCDQMYKIVNGTLWGASHQTIGNPDSVLLKQLPASAYDQVSALNSQIPNRFVTGSTSAINHLGSYFPDAGHYYIEVSQNNTVYRWYIEMGDQPSDIKDFITAVQEALGKLN